MLIDYQDFLNKKSQLDYSCGFKPNFMPDFLFDFQKDLVNWSIKLGRSAMFADCGLGKTIMQLVWAENIARHTNRPVLILTPLAVSYQTVREGEKFGIECKRSANGEIKSKIVITNYERLHYFDKTKFAGVVCDESGILKHFSGATQKSVTEFMRKIQYRLLGTATAAPNDYTELGTSAEALGLMGYMDMLSRFFRNTQGSIDTKRHWRSHGTKGPLWRFKKHAENPFWRWVCSWAKMIRKPSDLGYDDKNFILPPLIEEEKIIECSRPLPGKLFIEPARNLKEQREERRMTITERCETVAELVNCNNSAVVWCHLNDEGNLLAKLISDSIQVSGSDSEEKKEAAFVNFINGNERVLITKPKIGGFGLNLQHCNHMTTFPSHSWEQYYQSTRRLWRFGQKRPVRVDIITTQGEFAVLKNLQRKARAADAMFSNLVKYANDSKNIVLSEKHEKKMETPQWL
jgi:hypothetical protein